MIGISNILCFVLIFYIGLVIYFIVFGFFEGCYVFLVFVLIGDIVGRDKMVYGVGVLFVFKFVFFILGFLIVGKWRRNKKKMYFLWNNMYKIVSVFVFIKLLLFGLIIK